MEFYIVLPSLFLIKNGWNFKSNIRLIIELPLIISKIISWPTRKRKLSNIIQISFAILGILQNLQQKVIMPR